MPRRRLNKHLRLITAAALTVICAAPPVQQMMRVPSDLRIPVGQEALVPLHLLGKPHATSSDLHVVNVHDIVNAGQGDVSVMSMHIGNAIVSTRLFGILPWKKVRIHVLPQHIVYVGGQSIGVSLHAEGVAVVGFHRVGYSHRSPAVDAHVQIGDIICQIDQHQVRSVEDITKWIGTGDAVHLVIRHNGKLRTIQVQPAKDESAHIQLGIYARDKTSGVGTLTFYDPQSHRFGALGHVVTDVDTGQPIKGSGDVFPAEVTGVVKGTAGRPGVKRGRFLATSHRIGLIEKNTSFGVFGSMQRKPNLLASSPMIPIAYPEEVHEGEAKLLTVVSGTKVEQFTVRIENLVKQNQPDIKSMTVRIIDKRLLTKTGGIIQGMSGSPLIQNGKLIGAVTHVFVSDPTRGYGVYAQWMLGDSISEKAMTRDRQESLPALKTMGDGAF